MRGPLRTQWRAKQGSGKPAAAGAAINGPAANAGSGALGAPAAGHEEVDAIGLFHGVLLVGGVDEGCKSASGVSRASIVSQRPARTVLVSGAASGALALEPAGQCGVGRSGTPAARRPLTAPGRRSHAQAGLKPSGSRHLAARAWRFAFPQVAANCISNLTRRRERKGAQGVFLLATGLFQAPCGPAVAVAPGRFTSRNSRAKLGNHLVK